MRANFSRIEPSGVRTLRKNHTRTIAIPDNGRFRSEIVVRSLSMLSGAMEGLQNNHRQFDPAIAPPWSGVRYRKRPRFHGDVPAVGRRRTREPKSSR